MRKLISEDFVKKNVKRYLTESGWSTRYKEKKLHEKGVDIVVVNDKASRYFFIEAKGESISAAVNYDNVIWGVGQIVFRMKVIAKHAYLYGVAYPKSLADKAIKKIPYQFAKEIGFYVFSVDNNSNVVKYNWRDMEKNQK